MFFHRLSVLISALLISFSLNAQDSLTEPYQLIGVVHTEKDVPLEFGNAMLLNPSDSSMIKGAIFMDGQLKIEEISTEKFLLKITSLGFDDLFFSIDNSAKKPIVDLGKITLTEGSTQLDKIEITARKPVFSMQGDKIVVDVSGSDMSTSGTAMDVLQKSPQVITKSDNSVTIFGKGAATVYVDGQLITSNEILNSISSNDIKEVEIIKNPSAKYDAAGRGGVINIITKENNLEGVNGSVTQMVTKAHYWRSYTYGQVAFKKKKFSLMGSFWDSYASFWSADDYLRTLESDSGNTHMTNKIETKISNKLVYGYRLKADYSLSKNSKIGVQYKRFHRDAANETTNNNIIDTEGIVLSTLNTLNKTDILSGNNSWNFNYRFNSDTTGNDLIAAFEFANFDSENTGNIAEDIAYTVSNVNNTKRSIGSNKISIYTGKIDHIKNWKAKELTFESGLKYSSTTNNSDILFQQNIDDVWVDDLNITNGFKFDEQIGAGYLQFVKKKNRLNVRGGLRAEHTQTYGFSNAADSVVFDSSYVNFFPSAYIGYKFSDSLDLMLGITYTSRISRPSYQDLNPFIQYIDSVSAFIGNPYLTPSYTHSLEASLIYMQYASIDFGYTHTRDAMYMIVNKAEDGSNSFTAQTQNIEKAETYSIGLNLPYELDWWTTYNSFGYVKNAFTINDKGTIKTLTRPFWYMYLYNEFRFPKDFSMETTFEYYSSGIDGIFEFNPIHQLGGSITKKFFDKKLTVRFSARDILRSYKEAGTSTLEGFNLVYSNLQDTHLYRLAITWNFGKLKKADYKDRSVNQDEMNRIKQD
jgi:hypothetical protein